MKKNQDKSNDEQNISQKYEKYAETLKQLIRP